jgi:Amt family ammonium transporter
MAGIVCYYAVALKNYLKWDDALDVWGVHGIGGMLGIMMLGIFASTAWNPASSGGVDGLLRGNATFFAIECIAVLMSSAWAFLFTLLMLWLIDRITPVKVSEACDEIGLDEELHGEKAYKLEA